MNKSDTIGSLAAALAKAQAAMTFAKKDSANPFFKSKYADLAAVVDAIKVPLSSNGLAYSQLVDYDESGAFIHTILMHESGEWIAGRYPLRPLPDKSGEVTPQALGSAITYGRRYGLQSLVGVPADDDDGNAASGKVHAEKPAVAVPDANGRALLEAAKTLPDLSSGWAALTPAQRATLGPVKDKMKTMLSAAA